MNKKGKIYIERADGSKFLKEEIDCGTEGFMLTDDRGNRIWIWMKETNKQ